MAMKLKTHQIVKQNKFYPNLSLAQQASLKFQSNQNKLFSKSQMHKVESRKQFRFINNFSIKKRQSQPHCQQQNQHHQTQQINNFSNSYNQNKIEQDDQQNNEPKYEWETQGRMLKRVQTIIYKKCPTCNRKFNLNTEIKSNVIQLTINPQHNLEGKNILNNCNNVNDEKNILTDKQKDTIIQINEGQTNKTLKQKSLSTGNGFGWMKRITLEKIKVEKAQENIQSQIQIGLVSHILYQSSLDKNKRNKIKNNSCFEKQVQNDNLTRNEQKKQLMERKSSEGQIKIQNQIRQKQKQLNITSSDQFLNMNLKFSKSFKELKKKKQIPLVMKSSELKKNNKCHNDNDDYSPNKQQNKSLQSNHNSKFLPFKSNKNSKFTFTSPEMKDTIKSPLVKDLKSPHNKKQPIKSPRKFQEIRLPIDKHDKNDRNDKVKVNNNSFKSSFQSYKKVISENKSLSREKIVQKDKDKKQIPNFIRKQYISPEGRK